MKIYLDNAASTPLDKEVYNAMTPYLLDQYGIPSAHHGYGRDAKAAIETSRANVAKLLNALPEEIIFTSGGTEANTIAIISAVNCAFIDHIITSPFEHPSVLNTLNALKRKHDIRISYLKHDERGNLDLDHLQYLLRTNTRNLVSVMNANNEVGNLNDIETIGLLCKKYKALFHTDAAQTTGRYRHDVNNLNVNFLAASGHKFHGPKGIGFLYCRKGTRLSPALYGSKTENIPGIIGLSRALAIAHSEMEAQEKYIRGLKKRMIQQLAERLPSLTFNGNSEFSAKSIYTILNINLPPANTNRSLVQYLDDNQVAVTGGNSSSSIVLKALGIESHTDNIRFSFSKYNTVEEIDHVAAVIAAVYQTVAA
ncbi:cysteine desulfurase family protein [Mucilaginibacter xinganensis]|uniref:Cysteine desulfurase n=1 Tax=Mucilaginibacter xinganensis TaxID=1234841 RepID=A0A223NW69_9SPHI|nr:cysteine desulfurase family protein [Mucilaginibacter xinganensis]ASU33944.1 cysteine desulfurase [Mucilaginibacter xinganensis]